MSDKTNAKEAQASVDKDKATAEDINQAEESMTGQKEVSPDNPNEPTEIPGESSQERVDRHVASTELPAGEVTPPESQAKVDTDGDGEPDEWETSEAADASEKIVPGAAVGPEPDGTIRNDEGKPAYAPPGSYNAAMSGVQQDASGHVDSVHTDNSSKSGTRI